MAYIVINNNNRQSYTLRNTANKPRVVLKSNGTSYIPLKVGTDTRATRLGFNINGNHYKAGGETSTTSIQSNTTYTYFGAQTYRTSTYVATETTSTIQTYMDYVSGSYRTTWYQTVTSRNSIYTGSYTTGYNGVNNGLMCSWSVANHVYSVDYTHKMSQNNNVRKGYMYQTVSKSGYKTSSLTERSTYQPSRYAPTFTVTETVTYQYVAQTSTERVYIYNSVQSITYGRTSKGTKSYDYGYNVEVGNTTTTVQTTTEV